MDHRPLAGCLVPQGDQQPFNVAAAIAPTNQILTTIEVSSHRALFDFFKRINSDDNGLYAAQFDMLLGTYCNTLTFVKFLELGLSVACVCTRFPELGYVNEGTIQFEVQQPMIARDGPHAADQPVHNYMTKRINRRSLQSAFVIAAEALGLLTAETFDGTRISENLRVRAIQQLARNIQTVLDSFERGTADQMLRILLEKAPPMSLIVPLSRCRDEGRLTSQVARATLVSELKRRVCEDSFFMSKSFHHKDVVLAKLTELVGCTRPSVAVPRLTHSDTHGRQVDGVLVTTSSVRQRLLNGFLTLTDTHADVPVAYGEMMITGSNLVTALVMGKAVRNLDDVARHLLNVRQEILVAENREILNEYEDEPKTARVRADLVTIGDRLVFLESLERRVYQATQVPYPLLGNIDLTFIMPLGLFKRPVDRYSRHAGDYVPVPGTHDQRTFPPKQIFFLNKDGQLVSLTLESAIGTVCHPSILDVDSAVEYLRRDPPELTAVFGSYVAAPVIGPLEIQIREFYEAWGNYMLAGQVPLWVSEQMMTTEQMLSCGNPRLALELHPLFDFFSAPGDLAVPGPINIPPVMPTVNVTWRVANCNIPLPLCTTDFRNERGHELSFGRHKLSQATVDAVRGTFNDRNYPAAFYIIEAVIHGSERLFCAMARLVMQCIHSYWVSCRRVAFVNSYPMVMYINTYLGNGELPDDCTSVYRDLVDHLYALRHMVSEFTLPAPALGGQSQEELNHLLVDSTFLPPLMWDCDALIYREAHRHTRDLSINAGGDNYEPMQWRRLQDVDFQRRGGHLLHNRPVRPLPDTAYFVPHHDQDWTVMSKIYYFVIVAAFSRGKCCTMGIRYEQVYAITQSVVVPEIGKDEEPPVAPDDPRHPLNARHLVPNSMNVLLHNARVVTDSDALLTLQEVVSDAAERTTCILAGAAPDVGAMTAGTRGIRTYDGSLHHGLLMMAYPRNDGTIMDGTFFYPAPVNALFACHEHLAAMRDITPRISSLARDIPPVPVFLGANYYSSVRQPVSRYVSESQLNENSMTYALMAGFFKMSPVAFLHQLRTGLHPGIAMTVVRQDRFLSENALFAEKASESYFMGQLQIGRHNSAGGINFTLTQPRANVDLGVGFTAAHTSMMLRTPVTDMGNLPQNLFLTRGAAPMLDVDTEEFLRVTVSAGNRLAPRGPVPFLGPALPPTPPGLEHGQESVCEFIVTPVSADLDYFRGPCNPRGRAGGAIYSGEGDNDIITMMYDHSFPDAAFPSRATNNPWASQRNSYGDRLYNGAYNLSGASPIYSPCFKFFTTTEVAAKCRCLVRLITEAGSAIAMFPSDTEYQFKRPAGSTEMTEDPCGLFQEAYPPLCSTDQALMRTQRAGEIGADETHYAQYLIRDASPVRGCLPLL
ncbi:major capsid protein [Spheniscid alphaherpesvirus 1]|uniref:Major capsid protein n=1 Tax=Spheniscid alphaherpesvirus 1 TaxID=2560777 RepID=A0A1R3T1X5_9ALPH|nr:major capsid protein [Spheniscid alphaherpesvirus 1]